MPGVVDEAPHKKEPNKLILCFDGTGNQFTGSNGDTNVVKLLNKLDRNHAHQYHYYQTGIGTYSVNERSVNQSWLGRVTTSISQIIDTGVATTFDAHVMAGYRFLMRYYESGDKIYMFGFSRGAFTAKFLARMIHRVGLLCRGNEEMVPFAFRLYTHYLSLARIMRKTKKDVFKPDIKDREDAPLLDGDDEEDDDEDVSEDEFSQLTEEQTLLLPQGISEEQLSEEFKEALNKIKAFKHTFCRKDQRSQHEHEHNIKVFFLGIWDCVNSVAVLEQTASQPVPVLGTARYVRHAVSVDERRVKFKPALLAQDIRVIDKINKGNKGQTNGINGTNGTNGAGGSKVRVEEDIKEVWFPGNHGDVGGGWPSEPPTKQSIWQKITGFFTSDRAKKPSSDVRNDQFQLSDIPLAWMIRELEIVGKKHPEASVKWTRRVDGFKKRYQERKEQALSGFIHDPLKFGFGTGFFKVIFWWFLEVSPFITRWELEKDKWEPRQFPPNLGYARDIPKDAVLHESLKWRIENDPAYFPPNNHGDSGLACLKREGWKPELELEPLRKHLQETRDMDHQTYTFKR